ncbi:hypothetical protein MRX96_056549 [Rhipicephalus microplus]
MSNINPKVRTASLYFIRRPPRVRLHGHGTARLAECPTGAVLFSTGRRAPVSRVRCRGKMAVSDRSVAGDGLSQTLSFLTPFASLPGPGLRQLHCPVALVPL